MRWDENPESDTNLQRGVKKIRIANAAKFAATDYACFLSVAGGNRTRIEMDFKYDEKTGLELTPVGEAAGQLYLKDVEWINFGTRDSDGVNLCDSIEGLYFWATEEIALEGVEATATLQSGGALPDLNVDFKLLKSGPVMISWNYA
jgi:hypothetical protein